MNVSTLTASSTDFRQAMRHLASGVSIIAAGANDDRAAITATSVVSFSLEPPTLLVSIAKRSSLAPILLCYRHFSVNLLTAAHRDLAERFAGHHGVDGPRRFDAGNWGPLVSGAPVLTDALAALDCHAEEIIDRYSHLIVIGRVLAVRAQAGARALVHWRGTFAAMDHMALTPGQVDRANSMRKEA